jgi:hypothetical protein
VREFLGGFKVVVVEGEEEMLEVEAGEEEIGAELWEWEEELAEVDEEEEGGAGRRGDDGRLNVSCLTRRRQEAIRSHTGPPWRIQSFWRHSLEQYFATWHRVHARVPKPLSHTQHRGYGFKPTAVGS